MSMILHKAMMTLGGTPPPIDPYFANVVSLMHYETSLLDQKGLVWSSGAGTPTITTSSPLVGIGSLLCSTACIKAAGSTSYCINAGADFTIEISVKFNSLPSGDTATLASMYNGSGAGWSLQFRNDSPGSRLQVNLTGDTGTSSMPWSPSTGVKYDIAISRVSGQIYWFVNGVSLGSPTANSDGGNVAATNIAIGGLDFSGFIQLCNAVIDEWRLTIGVGRYDANYTVSLPFPDS